MVDLKVNTAGWMQAMTPVALAGRATSWQTATISGDPGTAIDSRALVASSTEVLSLLVRNGAGTGGTGYRLTATASPLAGWLTSRDAISLPVDAARADSVEVTNVPAAAGAVHLALDLVHPHRGSLHVTLTSPSGTVAQIVATDPADTRSDLICAFPDVCAPIDDLGTIFRGEPANGSWTLSIDGAKAEEKGLLRGWALSIQTWSWGPVATPPVRSCSAP